MTILQKIATTGTETVAHRRRVAESVNLAAEMLTQSGIGALLYPITDAETAAGLTIADNSIPSHEKIGVVIPNRYAANTTPGTTDMTAAMQAALDVSVAAGIEAYAPAGTYRITSPLVANGAAKLRGDGASTIIDATDIDDGDTALTIQGSLSATTTTLASYPALNSPTLAFTSATGFAVGDMIQLVSTESMSTADSTYKWGELGFIKAIVGTTITLTANVKGTYTSGTVTVTKINPIEAPSVRDLKIVGPGASAPNYGIRIAYAKKPEISGVTVSLFEDQGVSYDYCDSGVVTKCHFEDFYGDVNEVGYAIGFDHLSQFCIATGNTGSRGACGFSTGGLLPVWYSVVVGNTFSGGTSLRPLFQTHINGIGTTFSACHAIGGLVGFAMFARDCKLDGCTATNMTEYGFYGAEDAPLSLRISDFKAIDCLRGVVVGDSAYSVNSISITDGEVRAAGGVGVSCASSHARINDLRITSGSPALLFAGPKEADISDIRIVDVSDAALGYGVQLSPSAANATGIRCRRVRMLNPTVSELQYGLVLSADVTDAVIEDFEVDSVTSAFVTGTGTRTVFRRNAFGEYVQIARVDNAAGVTNGTTNGKARTTNNIRFNINGDYALFNAADNVWDLTALATTAGQYMKVVLALDSGGIAHVVQGVKAASQFAAKVPPVWWEWCPIAIVEIPNSYSGGSLSGFVFHDMIGMVGP